MNLAYEAATADLDDVNMIDPYHLEAYGTTSVNYNRDVEAFPILNTIMKTILGESPYKSPTDMGVNMAGYCISDDEACRAASKDEIIRRYYTALCDFRRGTGREEIIEKIELVMNQAGVVPTDRKVVTKALEREEATGGQPAVAIELPDGEIITGKTSSLLGPSAAALLNAVKHLSGIPDDTLLLPPEVIEPVQKLKTGILGNFNPRLHSDEVLVSLAVSTSTSESARRAVESLPLLRGCEAHCSVILSQTDQDTYRKLGINLTCEPKYQTKKLFHGSR